MKKIYSSENDDNITDKNKIINEKFIRMFVK